MRLADAIHQTVPGLLTAVINVNLAAGANTDLIAAPEGTARICVHSLKLVCNNTGASTLRSGTTPITGAMDWVYAEELALPPSPIPYFRLGVAEALNLLNGAGATRAFRGVVGYVVH